MLEQLQQKAMKTSRIITNRKIWKRSHWYNKDQKSWNKDSKHQNNESKPKDACITVTKGVKYFYPTGYDEGIFSAVTKLLSKKIEQAKQSEDANAKTIQTLLNVKVSVISLKFQSNYMMQLSHR